MRMKDSPNYQTKGQTKGKIARERTPLIALIGVVIFMGDV